MVLKPMYHYDKWMTNSKLHEKWNPCNKEYHRSGLSSTVNESPIPPSAIETTDSYPNHRQLPKPPTATQTLTANEKPAGLSAMPVFSKKQFDSLWADE